MPTVVTPTLPRITATSTHGAQQAGRDRVPSRSAYDGAQCWRSAVAVVSATCRDRPRRITYPFTPRAGIERRAFEACDLHRQQVVARGDAGTTHRRASLRRNITQRVGIQRTQIGRGFEQPVTGEVVGERQVDGARDAARDGIDGLGLAAKTYRGAGVHEQDIVAAFSQLARTMTGSIETDRTSRMKFASA